ncbi:4-hydroxythreonine-4-phosphate dehydrogenase PdxA [Acaryochloris marina]|uniref:4-hydroxythreonine-4-phosphate dehydrogenase PdxA n=1 Tax=Acaryochloris marina TaxID=155978 RepID=UPI0028F42406|nr:4-hydroxythreonine-4-phosphate dehydrogenase PdxA [Acaryochloris marina]QUY44015.1 4-hydroxythreonine-4-phosphate dehydrogenase PdxA [Acaryochloris marina S15]
MIESHPLPQLAIPVGDPAGIGPEVILKALNSPLLKGAAHIRVIGERSLFEAAYKHLQQQAGLNAVETLANPNDLDFLEVGLKLSPIPWGQASAETGAASFRCLSTAITGALEGRFDGIVTGPIAKSAWKAAGHHYPGQTEYLAERSQISEYGMFFFALSPYTGWQLRTLLATTHIPLSAVPGQLSPALLTMKVQLLKKTLQREFGIEQPRVAIAGLNPHSGEQGQLGREEIDWLIPWIREMRSQHPDLTLSDPIPPDTLWVGPGQAWYGPREKTVQPTTYDAYLALYHDQGLIPVKLMAFDRAVNTTIGLPFVRTSPDHGTAFDIAGKGIADPTSMIAAIQLAANLVRQRQQTQANL